MQNRYTHFCENRP